MAAAAAPTPALSIAIPTSAAEADAQPQPLDDDEAPLTVGELFALIRSHEEADRLDGLAELSLRIDEAYGEKGQLLGAEVRDIGGVPQCNARLTLCALT